MRCVHARHPGRRVRLAYCQNVHPARDLAGLRRGFEEVVRPLRARLGSSGPFGVGLYLPASLARFLAPSAAPESTGSTAPAGARELDALARELADDGLEPFTFNAFPFGDFDRDGLKRAVFQPTWLSPQRFQYTRDVARVAAALQARPLPSAAEGVGAHVSISTHCGMHIDDVAAAGFVDVAGSVDVAGARAACARAFARAAGDLAELEARSGVRVVLALEPEPRSLAGDTLELASLWQALDAACAGGVAAARARHLSGCFDACHAAVEYEDAAAALARAARPLGKLQFTSALELREPAHRADAVARLLDLDEPRYLHQVTGRGARGLLRAGDLPELRVALADPARARAWLACESWRCHLHVPVDREDLGPSGLATTRAAADAALAAALSDPSCWASSELHLEIETYTWDVLPAPARGPGALVDALEREYAHVLGILAQHGWRPER